MNKIQKVKIYPYGQSHKIPYKEEKISIVVGFDKNGNPIREEFTDVKFDSLPATTLIQLSGGIDSTYVLWKWLLENPDDYCLVHHITFNYNNNEDARTEKQLQSVDNILRWFDSQGLDNYFYLQNEFDYGNFTSIIYDVEICGFLSGVILRSPRWSNIDTIILPIYNKLSNREERRRMVTNITSKKDMNFIYPLSGISKDQVMESMPNELLSLCWYCRSPIDGMKCGECHSCKDVSD